MLRRNGAGNIIDVHLFVEKGLFWGNIRKDGYRILVGKQIMVDITDTTVVSLIFHMADTTVMYRSQVDNRHDRRVYCPPVDDTRPSCQ